ncbi:Transcriptional activator RfaH [Fulvivirga imtechensis AK7]|uniref:Transcriptional activator RfaH n=1 Tax=Fulvivirga imtechensis AK7 TaxID=1237149 RepID=L8JQU8_9BACT|nr:UpxY family transcription antiterminator [Fulvivirga imtechensis]ELR71225.1 Transcriptional activator RfaH [Fulvivirga imtechensis AK7]
MTHRKLKENWYIAYTLPHCERKAQKKLYNMGVETFLPLQKVVRQWSDRKKRLEVPLFPSYIFIRTDAHKRFNIIKLPELVQYVSFDGRPVTVSEELIYSLIKVTAGEVEVSNEIINVGGRVRIVEGKFQGVEGIVSQKNGKTRLVICIRALRRSVKMELPAQFVEVC